MGWNEILSQRQAKYPAEAIVRFVASNFYDAPCRPDVHFLDIGTGGGAIAKFLEAEDFNVTAIDSAPRARAHYHEEIETIDFCPESFDCIIDHNTLCHVENIPTKKIKSWLKPGGLFFSVAPRDDTWRGHLVGKGYCRLASLKEIIELYDDFAPLEVGYATYTHNGHEITSWIVEGGK